MRPIKTTRMFDGKKYNLWGYTKNKKEAEEDVRKLKKRGYYARIAPHPQLGYRIFIR